MPRQSLRRLLIGLFQDASPVEWGIACAALLLVIQYGLLPREAFFAPDEGMRVIVSRNLYPESVFTGIIRYENQPIDPRIEFAPYFGAWFSVTPQPALKVSYPIVWFAALIAPLYALGGVALAQAFPLVCGVMAGLLAGWILQQMAGKGAATLGVIVVMLGIPSSLYSFLLWEHQLALALCLLALACCLDYQARRRAFVAVIGGAAATLACALRVETLFVVAPALLLIGWEQFRAAEAPARKRVMAIGAAMAAVGLLAGVYWLIARETPYRLPALAPAMTPAQIERAGLQVMRVFVGYDASPATSIALLGTLGIGGIALFAARRNSAARAGIVAGALIVVALITALSILRVEPFRVVNPGLLCGAPLLVLAVLPQVGEDARLRFLRRTLMIVLIGFVAGAFLTPRLASRAGGVMAQIGSSWGSRYFLALYPLMAVAALAALAGWMRAIRQTGRPALTMALGAGVALSLATGMLVNVIGLTRIQTDKQIVLAGCQAVWQTQAAVLVTDDWWRAPECAARTGPAYLLAQSEAVLPALRQSLAGIENARGGELTLGYASQSGRLSLEAVVAGLQPCFTVSRRPDAAGAVVELSLNMDSESCAR